MTGLAASSSGYRPDLDGLRAIAVSSVLLFHLGVPGFQGGFTGVDIFFVLSGFFISKQIDADFKLGRFSLLSFYERRIRRIVPALIFILACCTAAALSFLFPSELTQYLKSLLAAAFSASNIYFFTQSSYFGATAETQVLLHTWSLGVEEQFYILFPVLVISALKTGSPMTKWFVWGVGLLSLGACITLSPAHQRAAFFLLPSRSWQLFSGAAIGLALVPRLSSQLVRECAGLIGAAAIGFSVWRINATLNYPGSYALLPTVGSALIIWSTMSGETLVSRLLQIQPMPFIGLISYSLYLWHWPLIVFSHLWSPGPFAVPQQVAIGVVALLLSIFSWRFVERPFRHHQGAWVSRSGVFTANGMSLVAVVLIAVSGLVFRGWPGRFSESTLRLASAANDISPVRTKCHFETKDPGPLDKSCTLGDGTEPAIIVYGDSHGIELSFALSKIAPVHHNSVREFTASACSSVLNFAVASTPKCEERNATVIELLASLPPTTVILAPGWENASGPNAEAYLKGFSAVLDSLHRAHHRVIVIGPAPIHPGGIPLPETLARMSLLGIDANSYRFAANVTGLLSADRAGADFAALHGAQYLAITPLVCEEVNCRGAIDNKPLYYDSKHLSERGAELVVNRMLASAIWPNLIDQLPLAGRS